jgi:hypothetical protein
MVRTALDPGSRRMRASVTAAGSEFFSSRVPVLANGRHAGSGGNLPLTRGLRR